MKNDRKPDDPHHTEKSTGPVVQDRMNRRLVRVAPTDTIEYTLRRMEAHAVRQLLVYGGDRLVGMLGDREIQRLAGPQAAGSAPETVEDVMRRDVDAISPCAPLAEAATRMLDHGVELRPGGLRSARPRWLPETIAVAADLRLKSFGATTMWRSLASSATRRRRSTSIPRSS
jgi:hypothetical protein